MPHRHQHLPALVTCSGCSDVGELTDLVGRKLAHSHAVRLECAAAIGAQLPTALDHLRSAKVVLAIDGCASRCVAKSLDRACIEHYTHVELGELGFSKGHSPATEANVHRVTEVAKVLLRKG